MTPARARLGCGYRDAALERDVMQEWFESRRFGRLLISVFVAFTVVAMVIWNMPESLLRREGMRIAEPYVTAVGLDQNWSVFAPEPYRESFLLAVRAADADGTRSTWPVPTSGPVLGAYWEFRWGKWSEWAIAGKSDLCERTAVYAAGQLADEGRRPVRVKVFARRRKNFPAGHDPAHGPWQESLVCRVTIGADRGES